MNICAGLRIAAWFWISVAFAGALCAEGVPESGKRPDDGRFINLFDGKTLEGWHAVPENTAVDWTVRDGVIVGKGVADQGSYLVWKDDGLADFAAGLENATAEDDDLPDFDSSTIGDKAFG